MIDSRSGESSCWVRVGGLGVSSNSGSIWCSVVGRFRSDSEWDDDFIWWPDRGLHDCLSIISKILNSCGLGPGNRPRENPGGRIRCPLSSAFTSTNGNQAKA